MRALIWFRRDLRVSDNTALYQAALSAKDGVVALFVITPEQWKQHDDADCKIHFWLENVRALSGSLANLNIPLIVKTANSFAETPKVVASVAKQHKCELVCLNREYEVNELRRDTAVTTACKKFDIGVQRFHDRVIVPPREIKTKDERFYSVFTPYRRVWDQRAPEFAKVLPKPPKQPDTGIKSSAVPKSIPGFSNINVRADLWPAGESESSKRLKKFTKLIANYGTARDVPSVAGTSLLSPYLVAGVISPRQCLAAAIESCQGNLDRNEGAKVWVSELTWRDFYTHVMVGFPRVSMHQPFKPKTSGVPWRDDSEELEAWKTGQTGFPIVDAGMRQLNRTGWMHNRLRMVTAMFLTKNLLIDWRLGEQYFMRTLIDGDLAANNGGWQWSASTGTDSVPYFRIFNPFSQSKRFDPEGTFIKKMCPELKDVPAKALHDPAKLKAAIADLGIEYANFVVDYKESRTRALAAFKSLG
jgi:deoxyribodipyrimidine photo-lyase